MAPTAGWYDDPRDPTRLRYWDGSAWTEHLRAKQPEAQPAVVTPVFPGAAQAQDQTWQYGEPTYRQTGPPWQQAPGRPPKGPTTPDGVVITTWLKRFAAWLLDTVIVFIGSLPLTGYFFYRAFQEVSDEMDDGTYSMLSPSSEVIRWELPAIAIIAVVTLLYQVLSLRWWGATPGKRLLNISVRSWDHGGQLSWSTIAKRVGFIFGISAAGLIPVIGIAATIVGVLDYLYPLWDRRRQALHDKFADTVVIEGARNERPRLGS